MCIFSMADPDDTQILYADDTQSFTSSFDISVLLPSVISSFFTLNKGEGWAGPLGSSPRLTRNQASLFLLPLRIKA